MSTNREKLLELGEWCGTDVGAFLKLNAFMHDVEIGESPQHKAFQAHFDMVHHCFKLILGNPE